MAWTAHTARPRTLIPCLTHELLNEFREEDLYLTRGRLRGVRAVDHVLPDLQGVVAANRARTGLDRVRRPSKGPERLDGSFALGDQRHGRPRGDELNDIGEERLLRMLCVVRVRVHLVDYPQVHRYYPQALALNA